MIHSFILNIFQFFNVFLGLLRLVVVGDLAEVSEIHGASIFKIDSEDKGSTNLQKSTTLPTTAQCIEPRTQ